MDCGAARSTRCSGRPAWRPGPPPVTARFGRGPAQHMDIAMVGRSGRRPDHARAATKRTARGAATPHPPPAGPVPAPDVDAAPWPQHPRRRDDIDVNPSFQSTTYDRGTVREGPLINHRAQNISVRPAGAVSRPVPGLHEAPRAAPPDAGSAHRGGPGRAHTRRSLAPPRRAGRSQGGAGSRSAGRLTGGSGRATMELLF
jgi:hypothetical protein